MSILQMSLRIPLQSSFFSGENPLILPRKPSHLSLTTTTTKWPVIRMGGGPRTFPGGVSKWQWKRMQAKKSKQLLKARLVRERQIYEMRKRAELQAAVTELERPWEAVKKAPTLFSATADEQVRALADRFQKPGGFDLWSDKDGPQMFDAVDDSHSSSRFFPKGVVHRTKPYQTEIRVHGNEPNDDKKHGFKDESSKNRKPLKNGRITKNGVVIKGNEPNDDKKHGFKDESSKNRKPLKNGRITKNGVVIKGNNAKSRRDKDSKNEVYDMNLWNDGIYEFGRES